MSVTVQIFNIKINMKASEHVFFRLCVRGKSFLDPVVFIRDFLQCLYIFSSIKCMFGGKYAPSVARQSKGKGEMAVVRPKSLKERGRARQEKEKQRE